MSNKMNHVQFKSASSATPKLLVGGLLASGLAGAAWPSGWAEASITPPVSVPSAYSVSSPVATSAAGFTAGLTETNYSITPTANLFQYDSYLEGSNAADLGFPTLQGMANLETMVVNGSVTVSPPPAGSPNPSASGTYSAAVVGSTIDTGINTNHGISTSIPHNAIRDEIGYVYAPLAGQTYDFNLPGSDSNDDGTEVFLGGNGTTANGTVIAAQNANESLGVSADTAVTFNAAGLYRFEIFNAQTWGGSGLNFTYAADSATPNAPALSFYSGAVPEPTPLELATVGLIGFGLLLRRKSRRA